MSSIVDFTWNYFMCPLVKEYSSNLATSLLCNTPWSTFKQCSDKVLIYKSQSHCRSSFQRYRLLLWLLMVSEWIDQIVCANRNLCALHLQGSTTTVSSWSQLFIQGWSFANNTKIGADKKVLIVNWFLKVTPTFI